MNQSGDAIGAALPKTISFYRNGLVEHWQRPYIGFETMRNHPSDSVSINLPHTNTSLYSNGSSKEQVNSEYGYQANSESRFQPLSYLGGDDNDGRSSSAQGENSSTSARTVCTKLNFSTKSFDSDALKTSSASTLGEKHRWMNDMEAKNSVIMALTAFYAMIVTIFALVFELSRLLASDNRRYVGYKDVLFGVYMYGLSITFLVYCYIVLLLNPKWLRNLDLAKRLIKEGRIRRNVEIERKNDSNGMFNNNSSNCIIASSSPALCDNNEKSSAQDTINSNGSLKFDLTNEMDTYRRVSHDSPSAGSLFLRLGCIVFGVIGVVYYAFSIYLCISDHQCEAPAILLDTLSIVFVFTQMHFVFCNWKLSITGSQIMARLGTMHLIASNLWTWIRYILIEESMLNDEIRHVFTREITIVEDDDLPKLNTSSSAATFLCQGAECVLASMSEVMYTSIVEYSLISAGVMLIVWRNIDFERKIAVYVKRKHQIRINCSKTTNGLFFGLAYLAGTFTTMAIFSGYTLMGENRLAATVFGCSDIAQYSLAILGCLIALWQLRKLHFHNKPSSDAVFTFSGSSNGKNCQSHSQELLDIILLAFGMTGEMIYSVAGLLGLSAYNDNWESLSTILLLVHITRITQVGLQSCLIYIAGKLNTNGDPFLQRAQPGKQAITFLLLANISMFLMNLLEAEKAGISDAVVDFYGRRSWVFLVRSFSPLTIFYRFHSAVCLAEVWKTTYSSKE